MLRGTKITSSEVDVSSVYSGVDRVVKYDFTHRDVPEAFEGFASLLSPICIIRVC